MQTVKIIFQMPFRSSTFYFSFQSSFTVKLLSLQAILAIKIGDLLFFFYFCLHVFIFTFFFERLLRPNLFVFYGSRLVFSLVWMFIQMNSNHHVFLCYCCQKKFQMSLEAKYVGSKFCSLNSFSSLHSTVLTLFFNVVKLKK